MTISDWKIIQIRNDLRKIRQMVVRRASVRVGILFDLFLILLAFVLNQAFEKEQVPRVIWLVIAIVGFLVPVVAVVVGHFRGKRLRRQSARVQNARDLISLFDDEICYLVMSADSFFSSLYSNSSLTTNKSEEHTNTLKEFYYLEISYYLNKSARLLSLITNNIDNVIDFNDNDTEKISRQRFDNVLNLIDEMYDGIEVSIKQSVEKEAAQRHESARGQSGLGSKSAPSSGVINNTASSSVFRSILSKNAEGRKSIAAIRRIESVF